MLPLGQADWRWPDSPELRQCRPGVTQVGGAELDDAVGRVGLELDLEDSCDCQVEKVNYFLANYFSDSKAR